ncbi:amidohydrolase family protein [Alphaproteobacteria bacterium]|nr:amidohydrolase family protein [Alphaproteobacteria bacterium]
MILFQNATIFNGNKIISSNSVLVEKNKIKEVGKNITAKNISLKINVNKNFLMPGLIDAHFHANTPNYDFYSSDRYPKNYIAFHAQNILNDTLKRGFTTVRDAGGGDIGIKMALNEKLFEGPRFFYPGKAITQTGGHGDMRNREYIESCSCAYDGNITQLVDGEDNMRRVVREEFRKGANHIKLILTGGVSTNLAPIEMKHFSDKEIEICVEEAERRNSYVMAHCHTDEGALRCIKLGIRSIEHGSLISSVTAKKIYKSGNFVVPTLSAGHLIEKNYKQLGLSDHSLQKVKEVNNKRSIAIQNCSKAKVKMGLGSDLHGRKYLQNQSRELILRSEFQDKIEVLRSATSVNAEILQMKNKIGIIKENAFADLIILNNNPLKNINVFRDTNKNIKFILKDGEIIKNILN